MTEFAFWSVDAIAFELFGYAMSWLELLGTLANLVAVILVMQRRVANWPVGLVGIVLFGLLFYQIRLYSDCIEQIYYFATNLYGWWLWTRPNRSGAPSPKGVVSDVRWSSRRSLLLWLLGSAVLAIAAGAAMTRVHLWLPTLFPEPASLPWLDAATTIASFTATLLMAHKRIESWLYWIAVDIVAVGLYAYKGVLFVALLYAAFLVLATRGFWVWRRAHAARITTA